MMSEKPTIAILGTFHNGKSTFINCLTNRGLAKVGDMGVSVTHTNVRYSYGNSKKVTIIDNSDNKRIVSLTDYLTKQNGFSAKEVIVETSDSILKDFDIIDTPGFNANEHDSLIAKEILQEIDLAILLLRNKGISQEEKSIALLLNKSNIPFICVINCFSDIFEDWNPKSEQNEKIMRDVLSDLHTSGCYPVSKLKINPVYVVNLMWYWLSLGKQSDNKTISLCEKMIHAYWDDLIGTNNYSTASLRKASAVGALLKLFHNVEFIQYLISFKFIKTIHKDCLNRLNIMEEIKLERRRIISSICSDISNSIDRDIDSLRQDYLSLKNLKNENDESRRKKEIKSQIDFLYHKKKSFLSYVKSL